MFQSSCSELLVDTRITDPTKAYEYIQNLINKNDWHVSPELTLDRLNRLKNKELEKHGLEQTGDYEEAWDIKSPTMTIVDRNGHRATIEFGHNGYTMLGFYIEGEGDFDSKAYPIYEKVEKEGGEVKAFDGGSASGYEKWKGSQ